MSLRLKELIDSGMSADEALRVCTTVDCSVEASKTKQEFAEEADINFMMARFLKTGYLPVVEELGGPQERFGDFSEGITFMEALERVKEAQESFAELPAKVRERFRNDPGELLEFLSKEENRAEAVKLGLVVDARAVAARVERSRVVDLREQELERARTEGRAQSARTEGRAPGGTRD